MQKMKPPEINKDYMEKCSTVSQLSLTFSLLVKLSFQQFNLFNISFTFFFMNTIWLEYVKKK